LQVYDKARNAVALALSPVVRALVDPDGALQQVRDLDDVRISHLPVSVSLEVCI
jgi:zeta-carotene desaturase